MFGSFDHVRFGSPSIRKLLHQSSCYIQTPCIVNANVSWGSTASSTHPLREIAESPSWRHTIIKVTLRLDLIWTINTRSPRLSTLRQQYLRPRLWGTSNSVRITTSVTSVRDLRSDKRLLGKRNLQRVQETFIRCQRLKVPSQSPRRQRLRTSQSGSEQGVSLAENDI